MNEITVETLRTSARRLADGDGDAMDRKIVRGAADVWQDNLIAWAKSEKELRDHIGALERALRKIAKGEGRFSRDPLTHASNVIEDMRAIAATAIAEATGGRHGTHSG